METKEKALIEQEFNMLFEVTLRLENELDELVNHKK
ncbi:hypothetical protein BMS3Abin17_00564 [archaeon BMS3Abin17]|nr:hypothetical protein BMS3Abin17_00564 [archaeon BMS3Abin17]